MKYTGMPMGLWVLFGKSFERNLITVFGLDGYAAKAKCRYKKIITELPKFEKEDRFAIKWLCQKSGKSRFSDRDISAMKAPERLKAADRNPHSWNMEFYPYLDGSGYEARFTACGICTLMRELGFYDLVPAMYQLDYTMSEAGGTSDFVREYTLASGGSYCDCVYKKKQN